MQMKDPNLPSYGAEALPGGLREINEARGRPPPSSGTDAPAAQDAPVVGLIALMAHWFRRGGKRR
jgi:hypothetical protein